MKRFVLNGEKQRTQASRTSVQQRNGHHEGRSTLISFTDQLLLPDKVVIFNQFSKDRKDSAALHITGFNSYLALFKKRMQLETVHHTFIQRP